MAIFDPVSNHRLAQHLVAYVPCIEGAGTPYDVVRREFLLEAGTGTWTAAPEGPALHLPNVDQSAYYYNDSSWLPSGGVTLFIGKNKDDGTNRQCGGFGSQNPLTAATRFMSHLPWSDGVVYFDYGGFSGANRISASGLTFGNDIWCFRAGLRGSAIYQNGIKVASQSTAITRTATPTFRFSVGNTADKTDPTGFNADPSNNNIFAMFDIELDDEDIATVSADPFMFMRPADDVPAWLVQAAATTPKTMLLMGAG